MFKIFDGRDSFYQWDINQRLLVEDETIEEVHFCNKTDDEALVCEVYTEDGKRVVNVPNILLQDNWDVCVYAFCGYTKYSSRFKIKARSKPADYVYTETEVKSIEKVVNDALTVAKESGEFTPDLSGYATKKELQEVPNKPFTLYSKNDNTSSVYTSVSPNGVLVHEGANVTELLPNGIDIVYANDFFNISKANVSGTEKFKNSWRNWLDIKDVTEVSFNIRKLAPNATFEIEPNMFCMVMTGGETCIGYYKNDNTAIATDIGTGIFFSTETNTQADAWGTEDDFQWWYRVASLYQTSGGLLSLPFKSRNDALIKNAYLKNNHSSLEVWIYYLKQGGNK